MAQMSDFIRRVKIQFESQGADKVKADFEGARKGQEGFNQATEHGERANRRHEQSLTRVEGSLVSRMRATDKVFRAEMDFQKVQKQIQTIMDKGGEVTAHHIKLLVTLEEQLKAVTRAENDNAKASREMADGMSIAGEKAARNADFIKKMSSATTKTTDSGGLNKMQRLTAQQTLGDVISSLATGASPQTILLQQGEQFLQPFGTGMEGIKNAASKLGPILLRFVLNPITAIVGAVGIVAYAMNRWQKQTDALTISLNGLGKASGLSVGDINALAANAAKASGLSTGAARGIAGQYVGAGVSGGSIGGAVGLTKDFGNKFGMSPEDAAKLLADALADPARGAADLASKFKLVSFAQKQEIERLSDLGDRSSATAKLVEVLQGSLKGLEDPTWSASRALDGLKTSAGNFLDRIARGILGTGVTDDEFARQARQKAVIAGKLDEGLARQSGIDQLANTAALAARELTAQTYAEREAIVIEKGRTQALLDTKNATQHLMDAEAERLRMLAEAQSKINEYTRAGQRDRAISGAMTPYERERQQIIQEGRDLLRQIPTTISKTVGGTGAAGVAQGKLDTGTGDLIAEAVKRGMEPTETNFQKLIDEGVGSGKFRGRMVRMDDGLATSTINVPNINRGAMEGQVRGETAARLENFAEIQQTSFFFKVNQDLEAQNRLLDANTESFGKSTEEVARAQKAAELLNQAKQQGLPLTTAMTAKIAAEAAAYGDLAKRTEEAAKKQQEFIVALNTVRSTTKDIGESLVNAFRRGESAIESLRGVLDRLISRLVDNTLNSAIDGLFGKMGSAQTGSGGGFFGSLLGGVGKLFGFADGGIMTSAGMVPLHAYAGGGVASGPQMALFGEGRRPEAYVPLPDGRNIPVKMQGQQQGGGKVTINNYAGADVQATRMSDGELFVVINKMVDQKMKAEVPGILANSQRRSM